MIGIICAMDIEVNCFKENIKDIKEVKKDNILFYEGKIFDKDILMCKSGVGKVNAAVSTTIMIKNYNPTLIINSGCAGSLNKDVHVLDVVVSDKVAHHDVDIPGEIISFNDEKTYFKANPYLIELAKNNCPKNINLKVGPVVSGDSFIYKKEDVNRIISCFKEAYAGEMEGSAIAQSATIFNVPFVIIRGISDETLKDDNDKQYFDYLSVACKNGASLVIKLIEVLDEKMV